MSVLDAQQGRCATRGCSSAGRDVVSVAGKLTAFCRPCRLRFDAPTRLAKARLTIAARKRTVGTEQMSLPYERSTP
jgi:hypothetical protein